MRGPAQDELCAAPGRVPRTNRKVRRPTGVGAPNVVVRRLVLAPRRGDYHRHAGAPARPPPRHQVPN